MEIEEAKLEIKWSILTEYSLMCYLVNISCTQKGLLPTTDIFSKDMGPDVRIELYGKSPSWFTTNHDISELKAIVNRIKQEFYALAEERVKAFRKMSKSLPENEEITVGKDS